jgi:hypothetical protein
MGRAVAERRLRERQESMAVLWRIVYAAEAMRTALEDAEQARRQAEARAEAAEQDVRRIADAAEEMRADVAAAREAQRQAEARTLIAETAQARHRKATLAVAIASLLLSIAANVALPL